MYLFFRFSYLNYILKKIRRILVYLATALMLCAWEVAANLVEITNIAATLGEHATANMIQQQNADK